MAKHPLASFLTCLGVIGFLVCFGSLARQQHKRRRSVVRGTDMRSSARGLFDWDSFSPLNYLGWRVKDAENQASDDFMNRVAVTHCGNVALMADHKTAFVDSVLLGVIQQGPSVASGESTSIYHTLGIYPLGDFPRDVKESLTSPGEAKFHVYGQKINGQKTCIHVISPDFSNRAIGKEDALDELADAYGSVLAEFAESCLPHLRLVPLCQQGGLAGPFSFSLPSLTVMALRKGFSTLTADQQDRVRSAKLLEMCIPQTKDLQSFTTAFANARTEQTGSQAPGGSTTELTGGSYGVSASTQDVFRTCS
jgi:hypothetical protein